jgi:hypothetical protein
MPLPSWKTYATITTPNGQTATAETPVCALTETQAATSVVTKLTADGYTPTDGRVTVEPNGDCQH